jgi:chromate transporter
MFFSILHDLSNITTRKVLAETSVEKIEKPSFKEAVKFWIILGFISFGGTTGHISIMHDFLVEKKRWISNRKFFHALNACMILPGPEAHQLSIYLGWKLHGLKGGIISGICFVLPSMFIILGLSILYAFYGNTPVLLAAFSGLTPAVLGIILFATWKVGQKALTSYLHYFVALAAFVLSYFLNIAVPFIVFGVILLAVIVYFIAPKLFKPKKSVEAEDDQEDTYYININQPVAPVSYKSLGKKLSVFIVLWFVPFFALTYFLADGDFWRRLSLLFTQAAFLTIGGSYTVIPYVANLVTIKLNWLSKTQMVDGFALAETTPGPLIIVLAYVGFMAAFNHFHGSLTMAVIGLFATCYFTFLPNFVLIFMGASLIEKSQNNQLVKAVLSLITAAVVGVIVNLAFYLGGNILFGGAAITIAHINWLAIVWVLISLFLLAKFRLNMLLLVVISLLFGWISYFLRGK